MLSLEQGLLAFRDADYSRAFELLGPLAEQGDSEAQCIIGNMYQLGLGVERSIAEAIIWYSKSAAQGYGVAFNNLAGIYVERGDLETARRWYQQAEEQGFSHAAQLKPV